MSKLKTKQNFTSISTEHVSLVSEPLGKNPFTHKIQFSVLDITKVSLKLIN